jgi:hypothetical protein
MFRAPLRSCSGGQLYECNFWYNQSLLVAIRYASRPAYQTYQILVGREYKLQDVRRIKISVDIGLDLTLLLGRKMMYLGYDPLIIL